MKVINIEVFYAISQHAFHIKILRFLPYHLKKKLEFYMIFEKTKKKQTILQKLLREFLVHGKKLFTFKY